jgi:magnesium chelatase family protein
MAHRGVLFLDEMPEFRKHVLEVLRQPLEEGQVRLARANQNVTYPCRVMLVGAMNPCPCGYFKMPSNTERCTCMLQRVVDYHHRISGPMIDRIDITLETRSVDVRFLVSEVQEKPSSVYRERVEAARDRQQHRYREHRAVYFNAQMDVRMVRHYCVLKPTGRKMLEAAVTRFQLSARAHDRILKLARTRADLEGHENITDEDVQFAISCRVLDRQDFFKPDRHGRVVPPAIPFTFNAAAAARGNSR